MMNHKVVCIGAVLVDELFYCTEPVITATSNQAVMKKSIGGVMCNIAHHLVLLGIPASFITVAGNDSDGAWLVEDCRRTGIDMSASVIAECTTGKYAAILNPDGSLFTAAAVNPCEAFLTVELLLQKISALLSATIIIADTNLNKEVLAWLVSFCNENDILLCIETVSVSKAHKLAGINLSGVFMLTPSDDELFALVNDGADELEIVEQLLAAGVKNIWVTKAENGSVMYQKNISIYLAAPGIQILDSTGAGDAALAGWMAAYCNGNDSITCMQAGHSLAAMVLQTKGAIAKNASMQQVMKTSKYFYPDEK